MRRRDVADDAVNGADDGKLIAGYRCVREIGSGATARVFLARDVNLQRFVALKLLRPRGERPDDPDKIDELFQREAQLLASVNHRGLPRVYAAGRAGRRRYIAMEYVAGESLDRFIGRYRTPMGYELPVDVALALIREVAAALEALHEADTLHLDLKPANVIIGPRYRVCLVDLSLGRGLRAPVTLVGTPPYIAPEVVVARGLPLRHPRRADVYALAATAFMLLTGENHIECAADARVREVIAALTMGVPSRAETLRADLPPGIGDALARGLARDPAERLATPGALVEALTSARDAAYRADTGGPRVIAVDDERDVRDLTAALLRRDIPGVLVQLAADGLSALELAKAKQPDLLLLDLDMPRIDGYELCAIVRSTPSLRDIPILVVSGHIDGEARRRLRRMGVDAALNKGGDPRVLSSMARQLVGYSSRAS